MNNLRPKDYELWLDSWLRGRAFGFAFYDDYEVESELRDLREDQMGKIIADWVAKYDLLPVYRVSEVVSPGDPTLEPNRVLSSQTELQQMGTYLLDALFIHGLGDVLIFQSHEDIVALGRRKGAASAGTGSNLLKGVRKGQC